MIDQDQLATVDQVFEIIKNQTDYHFIYPKKAFKEAPKVQLKKGEIKIDDLLQQSLSNKNLGFELTDNNTIIIKKNPKIKVQQGFVINGIVNDMTGQPLPGANILEKGTANGAQTDFDGKFLLNLSKPNAVLVVSYLGFASQEIAVNGQTSITISLEESAASLEQVVVVGYGTQKKVNLTGAVSTVDLEQVEDRPVQNVIQAIQGQVPGLNIIQGTANPGDESFNINIRGLNSFGSSNNPLILIDGVEGNLQDLDPSLIKSISVLKDASSASIYGSRAANGVILVETKKGSNNKLAITYSGNVSVHSITNLGEMITNSADYMEALNQAVANTPGASVNTYPQEIINAYRNANGNPLYPNTDWVDVLSRDAFVNQHNVALSGTTGKTSINVSIGHWDQEGVIVGTDFEKTNLFTGFTTNFNDRIKVGGSILGLTSVRHGSEETDRALLNAFNSKPNFGPYTLDGTGHYAGKAFTGDPNDPDFPGFDEGFTRANPLGNLTVLNGREQSSYNFNANIFVDIELIDGLVWSTKGAFKFDYDFIRAQLFGVDEYSFRSGEFLRTSAVGGVSDGQLNIDNYWSKQKTLYSTLKYDKSFKKHNLGILAGYSQEELENNVTSSLRRGLASTVITDLDGASAAGQETTGATQAWALRSWFGRVNYNYDEKYLFEANIRADESSRFAKGNRLGIFPSFSAGWRIDKEDFLKDSDFLNQLKIRGSWGELGNQNINSLYPYQSLIDFGNFAYPFSGDALSSGVVASRLVDPSITWETTEITDIGIDFSILNRKLSGSIDYYSKRTYDILRELQINSSTGLSSPTINGGEMTNKGWDIALTHRNRIGEVGYSISGNLSWYKNKLTDFGETEIGSQKINETGYAYEDWYMWEADGIFRTQEDLDNAATQPVANPELGHIRIKDQQVEGEEGFGVIDGDDRVRIDGRHPDFSYGLNLSMNWKGFDFSTFLQGVSGIKRYLSGPGIDPGFQDGAIPKVWETHAWTPENPNAELPKIAWSTADARSSQNLRNSFWLRDASYARIKNMTLGYTFPEEIANKISASNLRVYFSGENLFTFNNDIFNFDPERAVGGDPQNYPQRKAFTFGLNITF
ncbi:TonB-dependent receptor [Mariniflexile litorale]|uniref:TonB-dependent receptor n=1 Tax=Mariniflexile litorale TaxID=3045158 RepID=A0AAU7EH05_9FLAO|nr:TonB-dependent receptor [Mariniflexile sp. KMM 9835]